MLWTYLLKVSWEKNAVELGVGEMTVKDSGIIEKNLEEIPY